MSTEITITKDIHGIADKSKALTIIDDLTMAQAVELLSEANRTLDQATEEKEKVTKPLNEALKAERARWKPLEDACASVISGIRAKMMDYQKKLDAEIAKREAQIVARVEKGTMKADTAVSKLSQLPDSTKAVTTSAGAVQWTTVEKLVISDATLIPREYLDVNEMRVKSALKSGVHIPGASLVKEKIPKNIR